MHPKNVCSPNMQNGIVGLHAHTIQQQGNDEGDQWRQRCTKQADKVSKKRHNLR